MNKIDTLQIQNFKFFQAQDAIVLKGNHLLLYGENGSGKSSIYWALYTLFEASLKTDDNQVKKYFCKTIKKEDCLVNIYATATAPGADDYNSFIEVKTDDAVQEIYKISVSEVAIRGDKKAKSVNYASDYINYRMLLGLSSFRHSDKIDLFNLFVEDVFKYVQFSKVEVTRDGYADKLGFTNAFEIWQQIEQGLEWIDSVKSVKPRKILAYKGSELYNEFSGIVTSFNESLQKLIDYINIHGPSYFQKLGYNIPYSLELEKKASFYKGDKEYKAIPFILRLKIGEYEGVVDAVDKPQSFLNEAKLSAIAISIRLAILSQKLKENCLKFIVLDDLLISLDMRNREKVLDLLLSPEFSEDYQLLILTHDWTFYRMAKHKIHLLEYDNWVYYEMYETRDNGNPKPFIKKHKTYLEKAQLFYNENNLEESANNLRKAAEAFCKRVLAKTDTITEDYSDLDLNGMLNKCNNLATMNGLDKAAYDELDKHRKFILNAASHDDIDTAKFKNELNDCLQLFNSYFDKVKVKNLIPVGTKLRFSLDDNNNPTNPYTFDLTLEDNIKIYKEPNKDSVLLKGKISCGVLLNGKLTAAGYQSKSESIQKMYEHNYKGSNKAKSPDFWEEVIVNSTGQALKTIRPF